MKKKLLVVVFLIFQLLNNCIAQNNIDEKLTGVWRLNYADSKTYMVITNAVSGAMTDNNGLLYYNFTYKITENKGRSIFVKHIPVYHDDKEGDNYLFKLKNDTTLLLSRKIKNKNAELTEGKDVLVYLKLTNQDVSNFVKKRSQNDLIGTWFSIFKKDTLIALTFKSNNVIELKDKHSSQQYFGKYSINTDKQPMELDITNKNTNESQQDIFVFDAPNRIRMAGPKNGKRRSRFTVFGNNSYLTKEK